jgi:hypothetical protein
MKTRKYLVSNSSSSSFIVHGDTIKQIADVMHRQVMSDNLEYMENPPSTDDMVYMKKLQKYHKMLIKLCDKSELQTGEFGVAFKSREYNTYILLGDDGEYLATTSNHHMWYDIDHDRVDICRTIDDHNGDAEWWLKMNSSLYYCVESFDKPLTYQECDDLIDEYNVREG